MTIEFLLIVLAVVVFGGLFGGLAVACRDIAAQEKRAAEEEKRSQPTPGLYEMRVRDDALAQELMLRQLEHYLRREAIMAERFVNDPSPQTLRAGERPHLGSV